MDEYDDIPPSRPPLRARAFVALGGVMATVSYVWLCLWGLPWEEWWLAPTFGDVVADWLGEVGRIGGIALGVGGFSLGIGGKIELSLGGLFGGLAAVVLAVGLTYSGDTLHIDGFSAMLAMAGIPMGGFAVGFGKRNS